MVSSTLIDGDTTIEAIFSVWITSYPEMAAANEEALLKRADEALYAAKGNGSQPGGTLLLGQMYCALTRTGGRQKKG
ncbi:MAG: hypothetical protein FD153_1850 [Rhodospirillaceae bacterium]|nr:MAG: hypothetical protein FD153_1850 [Rhodospirillaceae bacterium]